MNFISKPSLVFGAVSICTLITSIAQADLPKAFDYSKASANYVDNTTKKRSSGKGSGGRSFFEFGNVSNPYYFGGTIGPSQGSGYCSGVSDCENEDTAWKLLAGFKVTDKLAAEMAYSSLGDMHKPNNNSDSSAFTVTAVGSLPITEQFDVFAEGGLSRWNSDNEKGFGVTYGLGAKMHISETANIRAEWQQFPSVEVSDNEKTDINMLSVGVEISTY
jgi:OOP family OmpA-OmpF porin